MRRSRSLFVVRMPAALPAIVAIVAGAVLAAAALGPALSQTPPPFSIRDGDAAPSGPPFLVRDEGASAPAPPGADGGGGASQDRGEDTPAPFDINADGRAPAAREVTREPPAPATTLTPLAGAGGPASGPPVDARSDPQRRALKTLLQGEPAAARELRVNLAAAPEWEESLVDRPIVPSRTVRLDGEIDERSWSVFVSPAEAARGGTLSLAFTNAVVVLPEASRLSVVLNGREIARTAIDSPDRTKVIVLPIAPGLLHRGPNAIRIEAQMRHRVDCSIAATYELWTRLDPRLTGLSFGGTRVPLAGLEDLPAVGVGLDGATRLRVFQEEGDTPSALERMLAVVQSVALRSGFEHPVVEVADAGARPEPRPGLLTIVIGVHEAVRALVPTVPDAGARGATVALVDTGRTGPVLLFTGPGARDVDAAVAHFGAHSATGGPAVGAGGVAPPVHVDGPRTITLQEAGVDTTTFSGRRFRTRFSLVLPPDFFAAAYGEALLLLDAAYSALVEPGSRVAVVVNGTRATTVNLTATGNEVLDDVPVALGMQSFRPGRNTVEIVAELDSAADRACLPGATASGRERFALFDSTRLVFPAFARVGQLPDLASFAATGFPYGRSPAPVAVQVGASRDAAGAAGTLFARLAVGRGAPFAAAAAGSTSPEGAGGRIVVAPIADAPEAVLQATGAAVAIPSGWGGAPASAGAGALAAPEGLERYEETLRRLRQELGDEEGPPPPLADRAAAPVESPRGRWFGSTHDGSGALAVLSSFAERARGAFGRAPPAGRQRFPAPPAAAGATLVVAQSLAPGGAGDAAWTVLTAPTAELLSASLAAVTAPELWTQVGGRLTTYSLDDGDVHTLHAERVSYVATLPLSFANARLIAANWFSLHWRVYVLVLVAAAVLLGVATWALVRPMGRKS